MIPSLSDLELCRLRRKPSQVHALRFNPSEIDLSRFKSQAFENAIARVTGIPQTILRDISPERSREIAEIHLRYSESEQSNA